MAIDSDDVIDVPNQLVKAEQIPQSLMLLKMENENMMAAAVARPREPAKIVKQLQELIDAYPAAADDAIYSKPIGKVVKVECGGCPRTYEVPPKKDWRECPHCGSKKVKSERQIQKFAEGLSIRAAESIRAIYGFTRMATTTEILEDGSAKLTGTFVDYAAGNITSDERIVSPVYKAWNGKMERTPEDRFLGIVVKAEKSKLRRDIILDSVPNIVKAAFTDACEKKLVGLVAPEIIEKQVIPWFAERGLTLEHLEKIIGRTLKMGWSEEDRLRLKKIATAIKNEETTVAELLADIEHKAPESGGKVGTSDLDEKVGKKPDANAEEPTIDDETLLRFEAAIDEADSVAAVDAIVTGGDFKALPEQPRLGLLTKALKKKKSLAPPAEDAKPKKKAGEQRELGE